MTKKTVAVLGAGNFGTAVSQVLAKNGNTVNLWNWEGDLLPLRQIKKYRENKKYLQGVKLSKRIRPQEKIAKAVEEADIIFFAVPSGVFRHTIAFAARAIIEHGRQDAVLVDLSKGIDTHSLKLIPDIIKEHLPAAMKKNIVSISGPAIAGQLVREVHTSMNIASGNSTAIKRVGEVFCNDYLKLIATKDVIGVEVGGSFKNVYSIAMGICDALGLGLNTKAALITFAIEEIAALTVAMGGKKKTAYNLAGLGDLIGTALCADSRNRRYGEYLGKGLTSDAALKKVGQTVEGVDAVRALMRLRKKHRLSLPFAQAIFNCTKAKGEAAGEMRRFLQSLKYRR